MSFDFSYILIAAIATFLVWRAAKARAVKKALPSLLRDGALVIDVRSPEEFASGHAAGSLNYPLQSLPEKVRDLDRDKPIILCCASGARSGSAVGILKQAGFKSVTNGGSWRNLDQN